MSWSLSRRLPGALCRDGPEGLSRGQMLPARESGVNTTEDTMDEKSMQEWLSQVSDELAALEQHRQLLLTMARAGQQWLSLNADKGRQLRLPHSLKSPSVEPTRPPAPRDPRMRLSQAALGPIVREAAGAPLHVKEVWDRASSSGVWSRAKDPVATTDSILLALSRKEGAEVERRGDRYYRSTAFDEPSRATAHEHVSVVVT